MNDLLAGTCSSSVVLADFRINSACPVVTVYACTSRKLVRTGFSESLRREGV